MPKNRDDDSSALSDDGYEHWPSNSPVSEQLPTPARGYDDQNGLRTHRYIPRTTLSAPTASQMVTIQYAQGHPNYGPVGSAASAYEHWPAAHPTPTSAEPNWYRSHPFAISQHSHIYNSAPSQEQLDAYAEESFSRAFAPPPPPTRWLGRTKAEVHEDNMRIAEQEKVYEKRSIMPRDMADEQRCWVIELDDSQTIREYREIKEMKGEWKEDPRFEGAMFFVRAADKSSKK